MMKLSNCCSSIFYEPGWPENDICSQCGEHADAYDVDGVCKHNNREYQAEEKENNVGEYYCCTDCGCELDIPEYL